METYIIKVSYEVEMNSTWNSMHYRTDLEAVRAAFSSMWDTFSQAGARAAARVQADCEIEAAYWVAFGLCSCLVVEGYAGRTEDEAWVRASFLYRVMTSQAPAPVRVECSQAQALKKPVPVVGINTPAPGETLAELNAWRTCYGLPALIRPAGD